VLPIASDSVHDNLTEWQHIGNQIDAAMIFAGTDFVNVQWGRWLHRLVRRRCAFAALQKAKTLHTRL
jgi:hypothetical protein